MTSLLLILALLFTPFPAQISRGIMQGKPSGGTTVTFAGKTCTFNAGNTCAWVGGTPAAGSAVAVLIWTATGRTITSVCDGTGIGACTGSSTYQSPNPSGYTNDFISWVYYTCNFSGTGTGLDVEFAGGGSLFVTAVVATGNSTSGTTCNDGYNKAQSLVNDTSLLSGNVTTTNDGDLLIGLMSNDAGQAYTAAGGYTLQIADASNVTMIETLAKSTTGTFSASATMGVAHRWNAEIMAIK